MFEGKQCVEIKPVCKKQLIELLTAFWNFIIFIEKGTGVVFKTILALVCKFVRVSITIQNFKINVPKYKLN